MGAGIPFAAQYPSQESYRIDQDVHTLRRMAELNEDKVIDVDLSETPEMESDVRVIMLKAAGEGKYLKGVGIMINSNKFALYEEVE